MQSTPTQEAFYEQPEEENMKVPNVKNCKIETSITVILSLYTAHMY